MSRELLELSPQESTREIEKKPPVRDSRSALVDHSRTIEVARFWVVEESEPPKGRINWSAILGMAFTLGISVAFWIGVAWIVSRIWK
jgi:hypothetical protein